MEKEYFAPPAALRKLKAAWSLRQTAYIYGATGFGKTELVKRYLAHRRYFYVSCADGLREQKDLLQEAYEIAVIDDLHCLQEQDGQQVVLDLLKRTGLWLVLISRSPLPSWLVPSYVAQGFMQISEIDLALKEKEFSAYLNGRAVALAEEQVRRICRISKGNGYLLRHVALRLQEGMQPGTALEQEIGEAFVEYLEQFVLSRLDRDLQDFLMQVSIVDAFDLELAEFITGNSHVSVLLSKAMEAGNFIFQERGFYHLRPIMLQALRSRAMKIYGTDKMKDLAYNAGLYYKVRNQILPALQQFAYCGKKDCIKELLVRNARCNPGNGHYFELRHYYFQLKETDIEGDAILMAGMSMLYSLLMQPAESETWYGKLKAYAKNVQGGEKREALSRLAYLDIALPHRGSLNLEFIFKQLPTLLWEKGIPLPEFSVTSNLPSTMNGGKDFCHWSKKDRQLAGSIGKLVERILGRYGRGLVKVALGESLYEKGGDAYEILTLLTQAQLEAESGGTLEIIFVSVGLQVRLNLLHGNMEAAKKILDSFTRKVQEQEAFQLLPNIEALNCRLLLYEGDQCAVTRWLEAAPDPDKEFFILERYRYLTMVRCYLSNGDNWKALTLLEKLRYYAEQFYRPYISMEVHLLSAVAKQRMGMEWQENLLTALRQASEYRFLRLISEEGAAVYELLLALKKEALTDQAIDNQWFLQLLEECSLVAIRYPVYLKRQLVGMSDFSETALAILRLQAEGFSVNQIAQRLEMKPATVKYHTKENYRKLGVSSKTDAVLTARSLGLL